MGPRLRGGDIRCVYPVYNPPHPALRATFSREGRRCGRLGIVFPIVTLGLDPRGCFAQHSGMARYTYILADQPRGRLYIGVTNNLVRRVWEHREGLVEGYTLKHAIKLLMHFDVHETVPLAIQREKNLKHWVRAWKVELIEKNNPDWRDLWDEIVGAGPRVKPKGDDRWE
jgi:putative endonuclease